MNQYRLTSARIAVVALFAISCFGIGLYLWSAFGGALPLRPQGYRVWVPLKSSQILPPDNAPVRISGVDVGRTVGRRPLPGGRWLLEVEVDSRYAPLRADVRAIARAKTFFGEMYLELTPGGRGAPALADGATLPWASVRAPVELDVIFRALDSRTRRALRAWFLQQGRSIEGRGGDLSASFGRLPGFERDATRLLRLLNAQTGAVRRAVADTGAVLDALAARRDALRGLARNGARATGALARRDRELAAAVRALPAFERESIALNRRLAAFAAGADPVVDALRPAARALSPTLRDVRATAPELAAFVRALGPAIDASRDGAPELARFLRAARPLLAELPGFLRELDPILSLVGEMKRELAGGVLANWVAATQIADGHGHYLRTELVLNPEGLAPYERRIGTNRAQPYARGGDDRLAVFDARSCANPSPRLARVDTELLRRIAATVIGPAAPPCLAARPPGGQAYAHAVRRAGP